MSLIADSTRNAVVGMFSLSPAPHPGRERRGGEEKWYPTFGRKLRPRPWLRPAGMAARSGLVTSQLFAHGGRGGGGGGTWRMIFNVLRGGGGSDDRRSSNCVPASTHDRDLSLYVSIVDAFPTRRGGDAAVSAKTVGNVLTRSEPIVLYIYIFIRINCSFKNKKLKNKGKRDTQRVKEHNVSNAYTNYTQRKRKIT